MLWYQGKNSSAILNRLQFGIPYELVKFLSFVDRKRQGILRLRHKMIITVYGSYFPLEEKRRLIEMKEFLILNGYKSTRLVEDYPENVAGSHQFHSSEERLCWKSESCLEFSDVNFLVFTHNGKCQGVSTELAYCRNSMRMIDRRWRCVIYDEIIDDIPATSFMDRGVCYLDSYNMRRVDFRNDNELLELSRSIADEFLYTLCPQLAQRLP